MKMNILLFPFRAAWWLVSLAFSITGRLIGIIVGGLLLAIGLGLTVTIFMAILGIPLIIIGFLLIVRSLFR